MSVARCDVDAVVRHAPLRGCRERRADVGRAAASVVGSGQDGRAFGRIRRARRGRRRRGMTAGDRHEPASLPAARPGTQRGRRRVDHSERRRRVDVRRRPRRRCRRGMAERDRDPEDQAERRTMSGNCTHGTASAAARVSKADAAFSSAKTRRERRRVPRACRDSRQPTAKPGSSLPYETADGRLFLAAPKRTRDHVRRVAVHARGLGHAMTLALPESSLGWHPARRRPGPDDHVGRTLRRPLRLPGF